MLYLVLAVDPFGIPLKKEGDIPRSSWPISLPANLEKAVVEWNDRIADIVAAPDLHSPDELKELYGRLNDEGEALARRITQELNGEVKVRYLRE